MLKQLAVAATVTLAACGGGGGSQPVTSLLFLGNSLTYREPFTEDGGWPGGGMAASSLSNDYAHLTGAALGLPVATYNVAEGVEHSKAFQMPDVPKDSAVVVELGDNAPADNLAPFAASYTNLLDAVAGHELVCVSTWWRNDQKDAIIKDACRAHGGTFVYIGDLFPVRQDDVGRYANPDVDAHPHDWGMSMIAQRVIQALSN